jgi:peroxiredoxin
MAAGAALLLASILLAGAILHAEDTVANRAARGEPALPRLEGPLLGGNGRASTDLFRKRRGVLFLFASTDPGAAPFAQIVKRIDAEASKANIAILGVNRDQSSEVGQRFVREQGLAFPIVADEQFAVSRKLRLQLGTTAALVVDGDGYVILPIVASRDFDADLIERVLRETLHLPTKALAGQENTLGVAPPAPAFKVAGMSASEPGVSLETMRGDVVVVMFFLHTCPHCHRGLQFLGRLRSDLKRDDLHIVPISLLQQPLDVAKMKTDLKIDYPLYLDPDGVAKRAYAAGAEVPEIFLLDRQHRVVAHHSGMEPRIEALLSMEIRKTLGLDAPILLSREGYSGEEACKVCHATKHDTWSLTQHAYAFDTLV